jgi:hypothetical protein
MVSARPSLPRSPAESAPSTCLRADARAGGYVGEQTTREGAWLLVARRCLDYRTHLPPLPFFFDTRARRSRLLCYGIVLSGLSGAGGCYERAGRKGMEWKRMGWSEHRTLVRRDPWMQRLRCGFGGAGMDGYLLFMLFCGGERIVLAARRRGGSLGGFRG